MIRFADTGRIPAIVAAVLALAGPWAGAGAQGSSAGAAVVPDSTGRGRPGAGITADVAQDIQARWNAPTVALRSSVPEEISAGREVAGDVAIRDARLSVRGRVTGNVIVVNGDVVLHPGARIDGDLWVIGGNVQGQNTATIRGEIRFYQQRLRYSVDDDRIRVAGESYAQDGTQTKSNLISVGSGGTYNRVEGLQVWFGPTIRHRTDWGGLDLTGFAIARTASTFNPDRGDIGHDVRAEVQLGHRPNLRVGGRLFSVVEPIESWQLSDLETSLAAFLAHRDYRDYFERHGGGLTGSVSIARSLTVDAALTDERWMSRDVRDPFTLFRGGADWRPNPMVDAGRFHVATVGLEYDTRNTKRNPWSGWLLRADLERGTGTPSTVAITTSGRRAFPGERVAYSRGFADLRRYNRLGPNGQLNLRAVLGGWMGGDQLPLQRRLSVDAHSTPGFDFRTVREGQTDVATCTAFTVVFAAAECERIALAQIEYRGGFHVGALPHWQHIRDEVGVSSFDDGITWVVFADVGRGWLVGEPLGTLRYRRDQLPPLSSFRSDIGLGLDLGGFGIYAAKAVSHPRERVNLFLRVQRRF